MIGPPKASASSSSGRAASSFDWPRQYISTISSFVTKKSTAITATELATTAVRRGPADALRAARRPQPDVAADASRS